jgi:hypothetical protein
MPRLRPQSAIRDRRIGQLCPRQRLRHPHRRFCLRRSICEVGCLFRARAAREGYGRRCGSTEARYSKSVQNSVRLRTGSRNLQIDGIIKVTTLANLVGAGSISYKIVLLCSRQWVREKKTERSLQPTRPPIRSLASSIVTRTSFSTKTWAHRSPAMPVPTIQICGLGILTKSRYTTMDA